MSYLSLQSSRANLILESDKQGRQLVDVLSATELSHNLAEVLVWAITLRLQLLQLSVATETDLTIEFCLQNQTIEEPALLLAVLRTRYADRLAEMNLLLMQTLRIGDLDT
jgi:hypothetical protein